MKTILVFAQKRMWPGMAMAAAAVLPVVLPPAAARAQTVSVIYDFPFGNCCANYPQTGLLFLGRHLYGTTLDGGSNPIGFGRLGTVYSLTIPATGQPEKHRVLHSFPAFFGDGADPLGRLIADSHSRLYATTQGGGSQGIGAVIRMIPPHAGQATWTESVLHSFAPCLNGCPATDGANPWDGLTMDSSGALYGATEHWGDTATNCGIIFKLTPPSWTETVLHRFVSTDGCQPRGDLVLGSDGALYGVTQFGGAHFIGTVFKLAPPTAGQTEWNLTVLHHFAGGPLDGAVPNGGLVGGPGAFYGTTQSGGVTSGGCCGTVFELVQLFAGDPTYSVVLLHSFAASGDGNTPMAGLFQDANRTFWGTASSGGVGNNGAGFGTVFKLTPDQIIPDRWNYSQVYAFTGAPLDGDTPQSALTTDASGALYGTTYYGGASDAGAVYRLVP